MHPDFSVAKIENKVRKLREQIRYFISLHEKVRQVGD